MTSILSVMAFPPAPIQLLVAAAILIAEPALLAGFVLPSATAALLLGFLAYSGLVPLPVVLGTAAAAVICGDAIGYAVGRRRAQRGPPATGSHLGGDTPNRSWTRLYARVQQSIATVHRPRAARLVARHGGGTVFLARWLAGARTLVPRMVGEGGTSAWGFARWSVPAGLAWSSAYVLAGYLGGGSLDEVSALLSRAVLGIVAVIVTVGAAAILLRRSVRRPPAVAQPRTTPTASPPQQAGSVPQSGQAAQSRPDRASITIRLPGLVDPVDRDLRQVRNSRSRSHRGQLPQSTSDINQHADHHKIIARTRRLRTGRSAQSDVGVDGDVVATDVHVRGHRPRRSATAGPACPPAAEQRRAEQHVVQLVAGPCSCRTCRRGRRRRSRVGLGRHQRVGEGLSPSRTADQGSGPPSDSGQR